MADETTLTLSAITIASIVIPVVGWCLKSHDRRISAIEKKNGDGEMALNSLAKILTEHQLYAERTFAKDDSVQASLARIHDRLDQTATALDVKEVRDDVKILIGMAKQGPKS